MAQNIEGGFNSVPVSVLSVKGKLVISALYSVGGLVGLGVGLAFEDIENVALGAVGIVAGGLYLHSALK